MNLNERLKELGRDLGFKTDQDFADFVGYKRSTMSYTLRGEGEPRVGLFITLLEKVENLNPFWLLLGSGERYLEEGEPLKIDKNYSGDKNLEQKNSEDNLRLQGKVDLLKEMLVEKEQLAEQRNNDNQALLVEIGRVRAELKESRIRESELRQELNGIKGIPMQKRDTGA